MAKNDSAAELRAKQKAAVKEAKRRKKNSDDPKDWGTVRQIRETYKATVPNDPKLPLILGLAVGGPILLAVIVAIVLMITINMGWITALMVVILGITGGILLGTIILMRRAKTAALKKYEGQAGSAEVALRMLPKEWVTEPAISVNRQMDTIHRALGPGGLILIAEGEPGRVRAMLATEVRRHEQVAYGVKVQTLLMGNKDGQVKLGDLAKHIQKLPKTMSKSQIEEVRKRLTALDSMRGRMPIPKGPMPNMRGSRQAMRGR